MRERVRIQPYVHRDVAAKLRAYAAAKGVPDGAVVASALKEYLDRDRNDRELLMRRLDRNTVGIAEVRRDIAIVAEALVTFARAWFRVVPVGGAAKDPVTARRDAHAAYEQFFRRVASTFMSPEGFMVQVLAEPGTDVLDDEEQREP
jgi:hypothetical protein